MSIDLSRLLAMLLVTTPGAVVLSVCIGVGGCLCPIFSNVWRAGEGSVVGGIYIFYTVLELNSVYVHDHSADSTPH